MKKNPYEDMLYLPHHQSKTHPPMSMLNRAAQFSPFAALSGHDAAIAETARLTDQKLELSDEEQDILNEKLAILTAYLEKSGKGGEKPTLDIHYFIPDSRKDGGTYETITAAIKHVDPINRVLVLVDGRKINLDDIRRLEGSLFRELDDSFFAF